MLFMLLCGVNGREPASVARGEFLLIRLAELSRRSDGNCKIMAYSTVYIQVKDPLINSTV